MFGNDSDHDKSFESDQNSNDVKFKDQKIQCNLYVFNAAVKSRQEMRRIIEMELKFGEYATWNNYILSTLLFLLLRYGHFLRLQLARLPVLRLA